MIVTTLVTGPQALSREAAIAALLAPEVDTALILEGLPGGSDQFNTLTDRYPVHIARIAPGCPCCNGNLTMRVTLNRIVRRAPQRLFISLSSSGHLEQIRAFLHAAPYNELLALTDDIRV